MGKKLNKEEIEEKIDGIKENITEMMDTLIKVKGENYAKLITHTLNTFMLAKIDGAPEEIRHAILSKVMGGLIGDLAECYGFDLENDTVRAEFDRNVQAMLKLTEV
jgi:hypothetical protein